MVYVCYYAKVSYIIGNGHGLSKRILTKGVIKTELLQSDLFNIFQIDKLQTHTRL